MRRRPRFLLGKRASSPSRIDITLIYEETMHEPEPAWQSGTNFKIHRSLVRLIKSVIPNLVFLLNNSKK